MPGPFTIAKWAMAWIVLMSVIAMLAYPGGTFLNPSTHGYSFFNNSFSDLGATVARNGQPNRISAFVFDVGFAVMLLALVPGFTALTRFYWELPSQRLLTGTLVCAMLLVCACLLGVGLSPHDRFRATHALFDRLLFLIAPAPLVLLTILTRRDSRFSRGAVIGWLLLAVALVAYDVTLIGAPRLWTPFHVTLQKAVAVAALLTLLFEIREGEQATRADFTS